LRIAVVAADERKAIMRELETLLKDKYGISISTEYGIIVGDNDKIKVQITPPNGMHSPHRTTWRLRMHPSASFEAWGRDNIAICEEFDNINLMLEYLSDAIRIYDMLFSNLTASYQTVSRMLRNTHRF
jgi:hypothetical protein